MQWKRKRNSVVRFWIGNHWKSTGRGGCFLWKASFPPIESRQQKKIKCNRIWVAHVNQRIHSIIIRFGFETRWLMNVPLIIWLYMVASQKEMQTSTFLAHGATRAFNDFIHCIFEISFICSLVRISSEMLICFRFKSMTSLIFSFKDCDQVQKTLLRTKHIERKEKLHQFIISFSIFLHKSKKIEKKDHFREWRLDSLSFFIFPQSIALSNQNVTNWITFIRLMFQIGSRIRWNVDINKNILLISALPGLEIFHWQPKCIDGWKIGILHWIFLCWLHSANCRKKRLIKKWWFLLFGLFVIKKNVAIHIGNLRMCDSVCGRWHYSMQSINFESNENSVNRIRYWATITITFDIVRILFHYWYATDFGAGVSYHKWKF